MGAESSRPDDEEADAGTLAAVEVSVQIGGQTLLPPVSVEVHARECVALLGANGAGKTTLLRILSGRLIPTSGDVLLRGERLDERDPRHRKAVAALIGTPPFYPDLTIRELLELICATWGGGSSAGHARVTELLAAFELTGLRDRFVHELSSGQAQMFYLASVFIRPFEILLLDEPEQRLDDHRKSILSDAIRSARLQGAAVVLACHDHRLAHEVADRTVTLSESMT